MDSKSADDEGMVVSMLGIDAAEGSAVAQSAAPSFTYNQMESSVDVMSAGMHSNSEDDEEEEDHIQNLIEAIQKRMLTKKSREDFIEEVREGTEKLISMSIEDAARKGSTELLREVDRITCITLSATGIFDSSHKDKFSHCIFYKDYPCLVKFNNTFRHMVSEYEDLNSNELHLPYKIPVCVLSRISKRETAHSLTTLDLFMFMERFQQMRWYANVNKSSVDEVGYAKVLMILRLSHIPRLQSKVSIALDTILTMEIDGDTQRILLLVAAILSEEYTPNASRLKALHKKYGNVILSLDNPKLKPSKNPDQKIVEMVKKFRELDTERNQKLRQAAMIALWQKTIAKVIQHNIQYRQERMQTAMNRVESRKQEIVRAKCVAAKAAKHNNYIITPAGPSGPAKRLHWFADQTESSGVQSKRESQKQIALEKIRSIREDRKIEAGELMAKEADKLRYLQIAESIRLGN
jgi:hypothetical protein